MDDSLPPIASWSWTALEGIVDRVALCLEAKGLPVPRIMVGSAPPLTLPPCCDLLYAYWGDTFIAPDCPTRVTRDLYVSVFRCLELMFTAPQAKEDEVARGFYLSSLVAADHDALLCCFECEERCGANGVFWSVRPTRISRQGPEKPCAETKLLLKVTWHCVTETPPEPRPLPLIVQPPTPTVDSYIPKNLSSFVNI